jgi:hypothetical protein
MPDTAQLILVVGADVADKLAELAGSGAESGEFLTGLIRRLHIEQHEAINPEHAVIELHALIELQVAQNEAILATLQTRLEQLVAEQAAFLAKLG